MTAVATDQQIATIVWAAWSKLDLPPATNREVLDAVRASRTDNMTQYDHMKAAMRLLGWTQ